jgi:hypothetical protein
LAFTLDTYTADVPELHHATAETVSDLFLDAEDAPADPPMDLPCGLVGYRSDYQPPRSMTNGLAGSSHLSL